MAQNNSKEHIEIAHIFGEWFEGKPDTEVLPELAKYTGVELAGGLRVYEQLRGYPLNIEEVAALFQFLGLPLGNPDWQPDFRNISGG